MPLPRALIPQPVHDAIGEWIRRSTGVRPWRAEANLPRPELPYIGFEFRSMEALSSPLDEVWAESLISAVFTVTAADAEYATLLVNGARVSLLRDGESPAIFTEKVAALLGDLLKGRCTVASANAVITVLPISAGDLVSAKAVEGCTLVLADGGPAYRVEQNVYRVAVAVQLHGLPYGSSSGSLGDGSDLQTRAVNLREALSQQSTKDLFASAWARIIDAPGAALKIASATIGGQRETRATLSLTLGVTIRTCSPAQTIQTVQIAEPKLQAPPSDQPSLLLIE